MKKLLCFLFLLLTVLTVRGAQVTILDLPLIDPASTNAMIEVADSAATPRSRKAVLGNLPQLTVTGSGINTIDNLRFWLPGGTGTTFTTTNQFLIGTLGVTVDGGGSAPPTGVKGYVVVPYNGIITGWSIVSDGSSPTCTFDVWKIAAGTALPTVANTITAAAKPALAVGNVVRSTAISTWTTATNLTAGDIIGFNLDAVSTGTRITLTLETLR